MSSNLPCDLSIIIVNHNTCDFLVKCLNSVTAQEGINVQVIVIDNASQDGSRKVVRKDFPWVRLMANDINLGFARANNQALKICTGKYVHYLNPDTELRPKSFAAMIDFMEVHPEVGLAGTSMVNPDGSSQASVEKRYPGQRHAEKELNGLKGDIAWVLGASMIAPRHVVEALGGFDEDFFLYGEDLDLCLRVRRAGWHIGYISDAVVVHWEGQSERNNLPVEVWKKKTAAEIVFYEKHYSKNTIQAIRRNNIFKACWRIFTLKIALPFAKDRATVLNKLGKYGVILRTFYDAKANDLGRSSCRQNDKSL